VDVLRVAIALTFMVGGIGGILFLLLYRPPMRAA
jgi:hypothetical protein